MILLMTSPRVPKKNRLIPLPPIEPETLVNSYNKFENFLKRAKDSYPEIFNSNHRLIRVFLHIKVSN